ncbi:MAG: hypothetical protein L0H70_02680 [Xanthomonadales bacterium]|nr:hypothetical protein [Xanthomonadales bacterium]
MQLIAHRGFAGLRVENTLAAFANAIELGAAGAELDVHLSRDGVVIVHHDDQLNRAYCRHSDGDWIAPAEAQPLADMTYAQMQTYTIGTVRPDSDYAHRFPRIEPAVNQHIPRLSDVIALAKARSSHFILVVEIKAAPLAAANKPWLALVDATLAIIDAHDFAARTILCSFDWGALRYAKQCRPQLATWFTSSPLSWFAHGQPPATDIPPNTHELSALRAAYASGDAPWFAGFAPQRYGGSRPRAVAAAGASAWFPFHRDFTAATAQQLATLGLSSAVWSSNLSERNEWQRLERVGVEYLCVDYPAATT